MVSASARGDDETVSFVRSHSHGRMLSKAKGSSKKSTKASEKSSKSKAKGSSKKSTKASEKSSKGKGGRMLRAD